MRSIGTARVISEIGAPVWRHPTGERSRPIKWWNSPKFLGNGGRRMKFEMLDDLIQVKLRSVDSPTI